MTLEAAHDRPLLDRCRVVLVRPQFPGNIGSTARVMRNFGFRDLVLVAPLADPRDGQARRMAAHGEDVLEQSRTVADLGEAVADCVLVAGTSAKVGGLLRRHTVATPAVLMPQLVDTLAVGPAALVFGPEASGLANAELTRCHYLLHIPADETYPALNLAQAVAICLYEVRSAWLRQTRSPPSRPLPAPAAELEHMLGQLQTALEEIHFLYEPNGPTLMHALRHLIGRAAPTPMEVNILRGLARQIRWYVKNHKKGT